MKHLLKTLFLGSAFALTLISQAAAQTKVVIGHFGDPLPYKALIADGSLKKPPAGRLIGGSLLLALRSTQPWPLAVFRFPKLGLPPCQPA